MSTDTKPTVASPCIRNCCLNQQDICLGCFRSLTEIIHWGSATDSERQVIISAAEERKRNHAQSY